MANGCTFPRLYPDSPVVPAAAQFLQLTAFITVPCPSPGSCQYDRGQERNSSNGNDQDAVVGHVILFQYRRVLLHTRQSPTSVIDHCGDAMNPHCYRSLARRMHVVHGNPGLEWGVRCQSLPAAGHYHRYCHMLRPVDCLISRVFAATQADRDKTCSR